MIRFRLDSLIVSLQWPKRSRCIDTRRRSCVGLFNGSCFREAKCSRSFLAFRLLPVASGSSWRTNKSLASSRYSRDRHSGGAIHLSDALEEKTGRAAAVDHCRHATIQPSMIRFRLSACKLTSRSIAKRLQVCSRIPQNIGANLPACC